MPAGKGGQCMKGNRGTSLLLALAACGSFSVGCNRLKIPNPPPEPQVAPTTIEPGPKPIERRRQTTTYDIQKYLISNSPWVDPKTTVDTVKSGDPTRPVYKAGVCWMASIWDIKAAHRSGCDLLVTHEPPFWYHSQDEIPQRTEEPGITKNTYLQQTGLVVLRAHDSWDNWPEIGIRDSWAKALGLTKRVREGTELRYTALYEIPETTLGKFARRVAASIGRYGEDGVQVIGDPNLKVRHPAIGTGCAVPDREMVEFGADCLVVCYDGAWYWATRERMAEMGVGIICVEHGTSELPGIENLRTHLAEKFPDVEFVYFSEHPRTYVVRPPVGRRMLRGMNNWISENL
jgi:putative NIF3 family GTP cyclohydrolase 1 type 2